MKEVVTVIHFLACIALIAVVLLQTTKSEGLSGVIGGKTQSSIRGPRGMEEQLNRITKIVAVTFFITSLVVAFLNR